MLTRKSAARQGLTTESQSVTCAAMSISIPTKLSLNQHRSNVAGNRHAHAHVPKKRTMRPSATKVREQC